MQIKIDLLNNWHDTLMQFHIELLTTFVKDSEEQIKNSVRKFKEGRESQENEYSVVDYYMDIDNLTYNLDEIFENYFPNLKRQSLFLMICSLMEHELTKLCDIIYNKEDVNFSLNDLTHSNKGSKLKKIHLYLRKTLRIENNKNFGELWQKLEKNQSLRNQIVHNFGTIKHVYEKTNRYIAEENLLCIEQNSNDIILLKGFLELTLENNRKLCIEIQNIIRKRFDETYRYN